MEVPGAGGLQGHAAGSHIKTERGRKRWTFSRDGDESELQLILWKLAPYVSVCKPYADSGMDTQ